jgi:ABC-type transport system substrate-binding protein
VLVAAAVLAAGCQATVEGTTSTTETIAPAATSTTTAATSTTTVPSPPETPDEPAPDSARTVRSARYEDITSDNTFCEDDIGTGSILADTRPSIYAVAMPGLNVVPDLADPIEPPKPWVDGEAWVVEVAIRKDAAWSDGQPITAEDVTFTFALAGEPWGGCLNWAWHTGVSEVEVIDDHAVRITFDGEPGFGVWPLTIGTAGIKAEHFWAPHEEEARAAGLTAVNAVGDPRAALWDAQQQAALAAGVEFTKTVENVTQDEIDTYLADVYNGAARTYLNAVSGIGEPSGGPVVFADWERGISISHEANSHYYRAGEVVRSGDVTYDVGPFIDTHQTIVYGSQQEAALALLNGEIDHTYFTPNPAYQILLENDSNIIQLKNPTSTVWYLGFNLRKPPMSDLAFRRALAMMIDKDFLTSEVFQGGVQPAWTLLSEGNLQYFDPEAATEISAKYRNMDRFERLEAAVRILEEAGYTWDRKPRVGQDERGEPAIEPGWGILMPDGTRVPELEILSFALGNVGYFWFTSYSAYIERWLQDLGFAARAQPSTGPLLVSKVWPGVGFEPTFDLVLLGWGGDNQAFPTITADIFHSRNLAEVNDGNNNVGYINPDLDELADALYRVGTVEEAKRILWQLEAIIDRDLPYVVLHHLFAPEVYRTRVQFPFTNSLDGLHDVPGMVRIQE